MGNKQGGQVACKLKKSEIKALTDSTHFSAEEIKALWYHFRSIATDPNEMLMSKREFQAAMTWKNSVLLDRMFSLFDSDNDGSINYPEFVRCLSILDSKAPSSEKLQFSFNIYDSDRDGLMSEEDMYEVLAATVREQDLLIGEMDLRRIVEATLKEASPDRPGHLSFDEYQRMLSRHPKMLSSLSLNISNMIAEYLDQNHINLKTPRTTETAARRNSAGGEKTPSP